MGLQILANVKISFVPSGERSAHQFEPANRASPSRASLGLGLLGRRRLYWLPVDSSTPMLDSGDPR